MQAGRPHKTEQALQELLILHKAFQLLLMCTRTTPFWASVQVGAVETGRHQGT